jgi:phosphatidate cytidylyltransferase
MLKYRVLTGASLLGMVAVLYVWSPAWMVGLFVLVLTALATLEAVGILTQAGLPALKWTSLGISLLWLLTVWWFIHDPDLGGRLQGLLPGIAAWAIFLGCLFRSDQRESLPKLAGSFFVLGYVPALMQFILLLLLAGRPGTDAADGRSLLLFGILVIKSTDMGAYFTGRAIGKHKLIPRISPAKTWEGVMGGMVVAVAVSYGIMHGYGFTISGWEFQRLDAVWLGMLLAGSGIVGDLVESMLKRSAGVKDSGHWLKGLGGVLDVLDSLMFALPMLYLYLVLGVALR